MKSLKLTMLPIAVLGLLLCAGSCTSTPVIAPSDGTLTLAASPTTVVIDTDQGEDSDTAAILVQVLDAASLPQQDVTVLLSTTGGVLLATTNACNDDLCSITGEACVADLDCPTVTSGPRTTDALGIVTDELRLSQSDPNTVTLSALSGGLSQTLDVTKVVSDGNQPPVVSIFASPPTQGVSGQVVDFFADVDDPENNDPTCYRWVVRASGQADICLQSASLDQISEAWSGEQTLDVTLRVSDEEFPLSECNVACDPDDPIPGGFNAAPAVLNDYPICGSVGVHPGPEAVIAITDPVGVFTQTLGSGPVSWTFDGSGSSDDVGIATYDWDCGSGGTFTGGGGTATCSYSTSGTKQITLTVTESLNIPVEISECRLEDTGTFTVFVNDPPQP